MLPRHPSFLTCRSIAKARQRRRGERKKKRKGKRDEKETKGSHRLIIETSRALPYELISASLLFFFFFFYFLLRIGGQ
jgi:hypothetical protein